MNPHDVEKAGPDAVALIIKIMQRNSAENHEIMRGLVESLQSDYDEALRMISIIRYNVSVIVSKPHTDRMVLEALMLTERLDSGCPA